MQKNFMRLFKVHLDVLEQTNEKKVDKFTIQTIQEVECEMHNFHQWF